MVSLEREAWREWKGALARAEAGGPPPAPATEDETLAAELTDVRCARVQAEAKGSFIAVRDLLRREGEIAEAIRKRNAEKAAAALAHLDVQAIVDIFREHAAALPESLKAELREALGTAP
jgi:hypothetical protein